MQNTVSISYLAQENTGAYCARLHAVQHCKGRYLKFLDQDDELLTGTLETEIDAFDAQTDVVLSNWFVKSEDPLVPTAERCAKSKQALQLFVAPELAEPIDDFLGVGGVFTSAALYRSSLARDALKPVRTFTPVKADDWLIFAQCCLHGARYKTIDNTAYIWNQSEHQLSNRSRSQLVAEHYAILDWIETELRDSQRLTELRAKLLANYYAKQLLESYALNDGSFDRLIDKIHGLEPDYQQQHGNWIYRALGRLFGLTSGIRLYAFIKRVVGGRRA